MKNKFEKPADHLFAFVYEFFVYELFATNNYDVKYALITNQ